MLDPPRDENLVECAVCLGGEATAGVVHGDSMHKCLCRRCAVKLKALRVTNCPMCRKKVDRCIMQIF